MATFTLEHDLILTVDQPIVVGAAITWLVLHHKVSVSKNIFAVIVNLTSQNTVLHIENSDDRLVQAVRDCGPFSNETPSNRCIPHHHELICDNNNDDNGDNDYNDNNTNNDDDNDNNKTSVTIPMAITMTIAKITINIDNNSDENHINNDTTNSNNSTNCNNDNDNDDGCY